MTSTLVVLGDSYAAGSELYTDEFIVGSTFHDPKGIAFPSLLREELGYDRLENYATTGASLRGFLLQLSEFDNTYDGEHTNYTMLVGLTQHSRELVYDTTHGWTNLYPRVSAKIPELSALEEQWYNTAVYPQTGELSWFTTVAAIQGYCLRRNIRCVMFEQFNMSPDNPEWKCLVDYSDIYIHPVMKELFFRGEDDTHATGLTMPWKEFINTREYHKYYKGYHPNKRGHRLIADRLKEIIQ